MAGSKALKLDKDLRVAGDILIAEGTHVAKITEFVPGTTKDGLKKSLTLKFKIVSGDSKGSIAQKFFSIEDALGLAALAKCFFAVNPSREDGDKEVKKIYPEELIGKKLLLTITHRKYEGEIKANVAAFEAIKKKDADDDDDDVAEDTSSDDDATTEDDDTGDESGDAEEGGDEEEDEEAALAAKLAALKKKKAAAAKKGKGKGKGKGKAKAKPAEDDDEFE